MGRVADVRMTDYCVCERSSSWGAQNEVCCFHKKDTTRFVDVRVYFSHYSTWNVPEISTLWKHVSPPVALFGWWEIYQL